MKIIDSFIRHSSIYEVNICFRTRKKILEAIGEDDKKKHKKHGKHKKYKNDKSKQQSLKDKYVSPFRKISGSNSGGGGSQTYPTMTATKPGGGGGGGSGIGIGIGVGVGGILDSGIVSGGGYDHTITRTQDKDDSLTKTYACDYKPIEEDRRS